MTLNGMKKLLDLVLYKSIDDYDIGFYIGDRYHTIKDEITIKFASEEIAFRLTKEKEHEVSKPSKTTESGS